jgi:hypothetical protein
VIVSSVSTRHSVSGSSNICRTRGSSSAGRRASRCWNQLCSTRGEMLNQPGQGRRRCHESLLRVCFRETLHLPFDRGAIEVEEGFERRALVRHCSDLFRIGDVRHQPKHSRHVGFRYVVVNVPAVKAAVGPGVPIHPALRGAPVWFASPPAASYVLSRGPHAAVWNQAAVLAVSASPPYGPARS